MKSGIKKKFVTALLAVLPVVIFVAIQLVVAFIGAIILTVGYIVVTGSADEYLLMEYILKQTMLLTLISNIVTVIVSIPILIFGKKNNLPKYSQEPGKFYKFSALSFTLCSTMIISVLASLVFALFSITDSTYGLVETAIMSSNPVVQVLAVVVLAPICEEIVFRRLVINKMLSAYSMHTAVIVSALLFAIAHGNITQGFYTFLMGILLGYLYIKTKSLLMCIIAHFINNLIAVVEMYVTFTPFIVEAIIFALFLIPAILFLKDCRKFKVVKETEIIPEIQQNVTEEI